MKPHDIAIREREIRHDKTDARERLVDLALDFRHDPSRLGPAVRLIGETLASDRRLPAASTWRPKQKVFELQLQAPVGRNANGVARPLSPAPRRSPAVQRLDPPGKPGAGPRPAGNQSPAGAISSSRPCWRRCPIAAWPPDNRRRRRTGTAGGSRPTQSARCSRAFLPARHRAFRSVRLLGIVRVAP
jgi:hypothetical protein